MRSNLPVTQQEYRLKEGATIVSRTDLQGRIVEVNDDFVEAAGFHRGELMGQPHNLVRHPDMPPQAYADMWQTLQAGKPWTGLVKNRRKNGDHYWVRARVTPLAWRWALDCSRRWPWCRAWARWPPCRPPATRPWIRRCTPSGGCRSAWASTWSTRATRPMTAPASARPWTWPRPT